MGGLGGGHYVAHAKSAFDGKVCIYVVLCVCSTEIKLNYLINSSFLSFSLCCSGTTLMTLLALALPNLCSSPMPIFSFITEAHLILPLLTLPPLCLLLGLKGKRKRRKKEEGRREKRGLKRERRGRRGRREKREREEEGGGGERG